MNLSEYSTFPKQLKQLVRHDQWRMSYVIRVSDADTITVSLDREFYDSSIKRLRIRRLDAAELSTTEGKAARDFVQSLLPKGAAILSRTFKQTFDRFEADILFLLNKQPVDLAAHIVAAGFANFIK